MATLYRSEDGDSSPDPLTLSRPTPLLSTRTSRRVSRKEPLSGNAGNSQKIEATFSTPRKGNQSPSKSIIMSTGKTNGGSPWKIKVTVEAEPEEDESPDENSTPIKAPASVAVRSRTVTVPLKEEGQMSPVKRRGRPRKSDAAPAGTGKRSATPARKRSTRRRSAKLVNYDDEDDLSEEPNGRPKRRVRAASGDHKETSGMMSNPNEGASKQTPKKNKASNLDFTKLTPLHQNHSSATQELTSPTTGTRQVRMRKVTPARPAGFREDLLSPLPLSSPEKPSQRSTASLGSPLHTETGNSPHSSVKDANMWHGMVSSNPAQDFVVQDGSDDDEDDQDVYGEIGDQTMLQSEDFSMVSVDSLPSMRGVTSSPSTTKFESARKKPSPVLAPSSSRLESGDYSTAQIRKITPQSSGLMPPTVARNARIPERTPSGTFAAPSTAPSVEPAPVIHTKPATPKLAKVVRAGIALQGVVETERNSSANGSSQMTRLDTLFSDFGPNTGRELRAGLRLGEQLASRRSASRSGSPAMANSRHREPGVASDDVFKAPSATSATSSKSSGFSRLPTPGEDDVYTLALPPPPAQHSHVEYPSLQYQLASPEGSSNGSSPRSNTPTSTKANSTDAEDQPLPSTSATQKSSAERDQTPLVVQWQREREAVSRQIEEANTSQVIVIDDESEHEEDRGDDNGDAEEDDDDIWSEEASRAENEPTLSKRATRTERKSSPQLEDLFANDPDQHKPRRGKIPKTWRSARDGDFLYSDSPDIQPVKGQTFRKPSLVNDSILRDIPSSPPLLHPRNESARQPTAKQQYEFGKTANEETESSSIDYTGLFWESNVPLVSKRRAPVKEDAPAEEETEKLDLTMLLGLDEAAGESSPAPANIPSHSLNTLPAAPTESAISIHEKSTPAVKSMIPPATSNMAPPARKDPASQLGFPPLRNNHIRYAAVTAPRNSSPLKRQIRFSSSPVPSIHGGSNHMKLDREGESESDATETSDMLQLRREMMTHAESPRKDGDTSDVMQIKREMAEHDGQEEDDSSDVMQLRREIEGHQTQVHSGSSEGEATPEEADEEDYHDGLESEAMDTPEEEEEEEYDDSTMLEDDTAEQEDVSHTSGKSYYSESSRNHLQSQQEGESSVFNSPPQKVRPDPTSASHERTHQLEATRTSQPVAAAAPQPQSSGILSRFWSVLPFVAAGPIEPTHPLLAGKPLLPRVEPWTRTHYLVLDSLLQHSRRHPELYDPSSPLNAPLITPVLRGYEGYSVFNWGYTVTFKSKHIVIGALYLQLLQLNNTAEYEAREGKKIDVGDCGPRPAGAKISEREIMMRLFTDIAGEHLRYDEKRGREINRGKDMVRFRLPGETVWKRPDQMKK